MLERVYCDIDGVIADIVGAACLKLYRVFHFVLPPEAIRVWDIADAASSYLGGLPEDLRPELCSRDAIDAVLQEFWANNDFLRSEVRPYPDTHAVLLAYWKLGGDLRFVTRRADRRLTMLATRAWLAAHGFTDRVPCDHVSSKADFLARDSGPWLHVEDHAAEAEEIRAVMPPACRVVVLRRPWNAQSPVADRLTPYELARVLGLPESILPGVV